MEIPNLQQQLIQLCNELAQEKPEKCQAFAKVEIMEIEIANARESEKKMLDSLTSQTKQLEQTIISLEEAKLEMKNLNNTIRFMGDPKGIQKLRIELKQAVEAEEKSKKAMDDLAFALKEVTTESNRAKKSYFQTKSELERLQAENERLRMEVEESAATWRAKEKGFINCIKVSEEEIAYTKRENKRLTDSQKAAREEISNLRDIVKQAVKESSIAKEALKIAGNENTQLKDLLSGQKENPFNYDKQNYECRKRSSEAKTVEISDKELSGLITARSSMNSNDSFGSFETSDHVRNGGDGLIVKFPSENWRSKKWSSIEDSNLLEGSIFDMHAPSTPKKEKDGGVDVDLGMFEMDSPMRLKKKRQALRRFGDILRIRSFNK